MVPALVVVLMVLLTVGFAVSVRRHGYWKARSIGVVVVAALFLGYFAVLGLGQLV